MCFRNALLVVHCLPQRLHRKSGLLTWLARRRQALLCFRNPLLVVHCFPQRLHRNSGGPLLHSRSALPLMLVASSRGFLGARSGNDMGGR